ncbi:MAG: PfkB family carbohydrate kinase [Candidatus Cloacimonadaceae bacterium]|nr:PfkB family carbohydrate kinase [Candidatus Cloacimonadota bacterium]MDY0381589.1 PfkB family carbohydrate kinase [Candidatus Cloacimonadaceae bacterium]HCM16442.1 sugar kinase [Candidatus Cloacimonas sp.]MCK9434620.1 PfkB family carbohydrate kinase [Candidatus Cloacimonadota bacterium]MDD2616922.1 PfkB family carbohydrate kinase [Candidatus Cloacimonadota bacterium]
MSLVIVGSIGLDTISTPSGSVIDAIGGSAVYGSISASYFTRVKLIGVVGSDYPPSAIKVLQRHNINLDGLERAEGKTFRWTGEYHDLNKAETLLTELNVFADFVPQLPQSCISCHSLLLANIHPNLQLQVLDKTGSYQHVACDTMNFWIEGCPDELARVISRVHIVFMNEDEVKSFTKETNIFSSAKAILDMGPKLVLVKRGEYGSAAITKDAIYFAPAYPIGVVKDPTGAGDSFAGTFMACLEEHLELSEYAIKEALGYATVMAGLNVSEFSVGGILDIPREKIDEYKENLCRMTI